MGIYAISRDWRPDVCIVGFSTTDSIATVQAPGYLASQKANIELVNHGIFEFTSSDQVLVNASDGFGLFSVSGASLSPGAAGSGVDAFQIQNQNFVYSLDVGSANNYVINPIPAVTSYVVGQRFDVTISHSNTASSTLNISGLGAKSITNTNLSALSPGELLAGGIFSFEYDGTQFQLLNPIAAAIASVTPQQIQNQSFLYEVDSGAANAYVITPSPAIAAYAAGQRFDVNITHANTGASTLNVSGLGVKAITYCDLAALAGGELISGGIATLEYDGIEFQVLNPFNGADGVTKVQAINGLQSNPNLNPSVVTLQLASTYSNDTGVANAYIGTMVTPPHTLDAGQRFQIKVANSNTGASTFTLNTFGTQNINTSSLATLTAGQMIVNMIADLEYDGTEWQLLNPIVLPANVTTGSYFVSTTGSDTTGNGSIIAPWATVDYALTAIKALSSSTSYALNVGPGLFTGTTLNILPNVVINGSGNPESPISPVIGTLISYTTVQQDSSWVGFTRPSAIIQNCGLQSTGTFIFSMASTLIQANLSFVNCWLNCGSGNLTISGATGVASSLNIYNSISNGYFVANSIRAGSSIGNQYAFGVILSSTIAAPANTVWTSQSDYMGNLSVSNGTGNTSFAIMIGCNINASTLTGTGTSVSFDVVSFPKSGTVNLASGAGYTTGQLKPEFYNEGVNASTSTFLRGDGTWQTPPVTSYVSDSGTAIPASGTLNINTGNSLTNCGKSVLFTGSGNTLQLQLSTNQNNTWLGQLAGSGYSSGFNNTSVGYHSLVGLSTGSNCIGIGSQAGSSLSGAESNVICIGNYGVNTISNAIYIGTSGTQTTCYIAGIYGAAPVTGNTPQVVLCDNVGNLAPISSSTSGFVLTSNGTATPSFQVLPSSAVTFTGNSGTPFAASSVTFTGGTTGLTFAAGAPNMTLGGTLAIANGGTNKTSVTIAPAASSWAGWDANSNLSANSFIEGYATTATAAGTTTLTVSSAEQQFFTGSTTQVVLLPVTSTLVLGQTFTIVNNSTGTVTVESSGANTVLAMLGGTSATFTCILITGTTAASWSYSYNSSGLSASSYVSDSGTATPSGGTINLKAAVSNNCGSSVSFSATGSTVTLNVTDSFYNTIIGKLAGASNFGGSNCYFGANVATSSTSGGSNIAIGRLAYNNAVSANNSVAIGFESLISVTVGNHVAVGYKSGANYAGTDTNNIAIGYNVLGTNGHSNEILIGNSSHTSCFITGIDGVNVGSVAKVVTETGNQLGTATITAGTGITITPTANTITIAASGGGGGGIAWVAASSTPVTAAINTGYYITNASQTTVTLPATAAAGSIVAIVGTGAGGWILQPGAGQTIQVIGSTASTSITSAEQYDAIEVLCTVANTTWVARSLLSTGLTIV